MIFFSPWQFRGAFCAACFFSLVASSALAAGTFQDQSPAPAKDAAKQSREFGPPPRIPRQQAQTTAALDGIVRDATNLAAILPVPGAMLTVRNAESGQHFSAIASGEGVFRLFPLPPGRYQLRVEARDYAPFTISDLALQPNEVVTLEISLVLAATAEARSRLPRLPELGPALSAEPPPSFGTYREFRHRLDSDSNYIENISPDTLPPVADVYGSSAVPPSGTAMPRTSTVISERTVAPPSEGIGPLVGNGR